MRFLTAGESHGRCLTAIVEGIDAGTPIDVRSIDAELVRRQMGHGRGGRMSIEQDRAEILSGVDDGLASGSPIAIRIWNKDFKIDVLPAVTRPRPGHADLAGVLKYDREDARDILERASARETAARVAVGSICKQYLALKGVGIASHVIAIGGVSAAGRPWSFERIRETADKNAVRCCDREASARMLARIDRAKRDGDTLGGLFEVWVRGLPGYALEDKELHTRLVFGVMSVQAVKGVEVRADDRDLIVTAAMKPIATLMRPLASVELRTKRTAFAVVERSDVTAVPACAVVAEAMVAFETAGYYRER